MLLPYFCEKHYNILTSNTLFGGDRTSRGQMTEFIALPGKVSLLPQAAHNPVDGSSVYPAVVLGAVSNVITRFAPSPNGNLHIGHALSAISAHDFARSHGGRFLLRIEDIDGTRSRTEHCETIIADLEWLGLNWDSETIYQSHRVNQYQIALDQLKALGLVYRCQCSRSEIVAQIRRRAVAHGPDGPIYPGTCRGKNIPDDVPSCWRLDMNAAARQFGTAPHWFDLEAGSQASNPRQFGDIVLWRKDAPASYHLAATCDDAADNVSHVVRGKDLFAYTAVHMLLQKMLGLLQPVYWHHQLLVDENGEKLAKSRNSPTLAARRKAGEDGLALAESLRRGKLPLGILAASD
jgi:glutamyl-Q tRNA(Asp) synthetase